MVSSARGLAYVFSALRHRSRTPSTPPLILVDGTGLMFRSFFAMPSMIRPAPPSAVGDKVTSVRDVGAVAGFLNSLLNLLSPVPFGSTVFVVFDSAEKTFRSDIYPEYKAQRDSHPVDLGHQFDIAKDACDAFGWRSFSAPGFEADDVIATMAKISAANSCERDVVIIGSDKDFYQLVTDSCFVMCPNKKELVSPVEVELKFGVPPRLMVDLQSLAGDAVDNIPGIPGIGPKTAALLLRQFGSLEAVLDNAHSVKQPKRRESLVMHKNAALLARRLVALRTDVPPSALVPLVLDSQDLDRLLATHTPTKFEEASSFCERNHLWTVSSSLRKKFELQTLR
jgi:DNA polymerase I